MRRYGESGSSTSYYFILFYFILFYFILFYFILFYFILLFYFIFFLFFSFFVPVLRLCLHAVQIPYSGILVSR